MIKAIIFDFFDVVRNDTYNAWLKSRGYVRTGEFHKVTQRLDAGKITFDEFMQTLTRLSGEEMTLEKLEANAKVNYEVIDIINELRKKYRVALLSNAPSAFFRDILKKNNLEKYFDEIVVSSEVGHIKPSSEIFAIMLNRLGFDASETLFTDDNIHNIHGAEKAGIKGIHFTSAAKLRQDLKELGVQITVPKSI
ncbi:MAG TPA: HAD family phosphatase [Candidatus Acidoferrales bacterium]|nr:HAD family phosphatase [Candidatus Acidoferrales bacterium]